MRAWPGTRGTAARVERRLAVRAAALAACAGLLAAARSGQAADTYETYGQGVPYSELYLGVDGLGPGGWAGPAWVDAAVGNGFTDRLEAYLGCSAEGDPGFESGAVSIYVGLFGTPVDTDHFDLDLMLDVAVDGVRLSSLALSPSLELNVDLDLGRAGLGFYLRAGLPVSVEREEEEGQVGVGLSLELNPGVVVTLAERHQLLLEYDMALDLRAGGAAEVGGLALGYNVELSDVFELITQLYLDLPQGDEDVAVGLMVGLISTIPTSG